MSMELLMVAQVPTLPSVGSSPFTGIAVGSETSCEVENVFVEHINLYNVGVGIHIKTNIGRNITVSNVYMEKDRKGIKIDGDVGDHPDDNFNPNALPVVKDITLRDIWGTEVLQAGLIQGLKSSPFNGICLFNINLHGTPGTTTRTPMCMEVLGRHWGSSSGQPYPMRRADKQWRTQNFMFWWA